MNSQGRGVERRRFLAYFSGAGLTATLFPGTAALSEGRRWVVPNLVPQLDTRRLTLTAPILNHA